MEGQNGCPATRGQHFRQLFQKCVQRLVLVVHVDSQGLEGPLAGFLHRLLPVLFLQESQGVPNHLVELRGGGDLLAPFQPPRHLPGDLLRVGLVRIFGEHTRQFLQRDLLQALGGADPALRVHPQVQRPLGLEGKAPLRVDLHGGHAQVRQHEVEPARLRGHLVDLRKILQPHR